MTKRRRMTSQQSAEVDFELSAQKRRATDLVSYFRRVQNVKNELLTADDDDDRARQKYMNEVRLFYFYILFYFSSFCNLYLLFVYLQFPYPGKRTIPPQSRRTNGHAC